MGVYSGNDVEDAGSAEVTLNTAAGVELLGQQTSAASLPVVIASNQSAVSVTDAALAALTNASQKTQIVNSGGLVVGARDISSTPINGDIGIITNSIIYGHTTAGGGAYVEVKVNPSGALTVDATGSTITANQGTSPWVISGTVTANAGTNLNTSLLALDSTLTNATQKTKLVDTGGTNVASISAAGAIKVDGSAVTQPISAATLPLPTGAATSALQTQPGVDIGDVTVNNATGASAVNIQDGGNSLTVDAVDLDIRNLSSAQDSVIAQPPINSTATVAQLALSANTNATLLNANTARLGVVLFTTGQPVYVKFGATASTTSFTYKIILNNTTLEIGPGYTGRIDIMAQNAQTVTYTEF